MTKGFYYCRHSVYYGAYDEKQVSGKGKVAIFKNIITDHPYNENDWAVTFWDNHRLLEPEYEDLNKMIMDMQSIIDIKLISNINFRKIEHKLNIHFPKELKLIYSAIYDKIKYFESHEHFLTLDDIYIEQGIIVFFRKKRVPIAGFDMSSGCLARYFKKEWHIENGDICCYQFCMSRMLTIALSNKPIYKIGRYKKGKNIKSDCFEEELKRICNEKYRVLNEINMYGITVIYSDEGMIAWIRRSGSYCDIHAGFSDIKQLEEFSNHLRQIGEIVWK